MIYQLTSYGQVSEEEPARDQCLLGVAGWFFHDIQIWWVEPEGGGREAVCHQVDPEKLDRDQSLGKAQSRSQEDAVS